MLLRRPVYPLIFSASSVVVAVGVAAAARTLLPYEAMRRTTPEDRFLAWEGVVWMVGLFLLLMGAAVIVQNVHRIRRWMAGRSDSGDLPQQPRAFVLAPWWMLATGLILLAIGIVARARFAG